MRPRLPWAHQFAFAGVYAAIAKGFYADRGLRVIPVEAEPTRGPVDQVLEGEADYGIAGTELLLSLSKGAPLVALATIEQHSPQVILARHDRDIHSVHDLAGRRLGLTDGCLPILAYLASEGVNPDHVMMVDRDFTPNSLIEGSVDAICGSEADDPYLLKASGIETITLHPRASGLDFYGQILFTTRRTLAEHPEQADALRSATLQGWGYALSHAREIALWIGVHHGHRHGLGHLLFEAATLRPLITSSNLVEPGYMNPGRWKAIHDIYAKYGLIPQETSLDGFLAGPGIGDTHTVVHMDPRLLYGTVGLFLLTLIAAGIAWRITVMNRALAREVADRAEAEAKLRDSETRYRSLVESAPYPIVIASLETDRILHVNTHFEDHLRICHDWAQNRSLSDFFADPERFQEFRDSLRREGRIKELITRMRIDGNAPFWADISASTITFDGEPAVFASFSDISELKNIERRLRNQAETDPLTGIANRRRFLELLEREMKRLRRYGGNLCLLQMDLDHFKAVNDRHGHAGGDVALRHFTQVALSTLRESDVLGRLGGEEFSALLPGADRGGATFTAERLRAALEALPAAHGNTTIPMTVSIGVTAVHADDTMEDALVRGDKALYRAKETGRNRVVNDFSAQHDLPKVVGDT